MLIDLFGPMPDNHHILVAQDMVSKFPAAKITGKTDTKAVTNALDEIYNAYGDPLVHRSDNGPPFNSAGFKQFSDDRGIHHEKAFAYHQQANPVEGFMKPLGKAMKIAHRNNLNKSKALDGFLANYRATPHSSTGVAPGDILLRHGYNKDFPELNLKTDEEIREALNKDMAKRNERNTNLNEHRLSHNLEIGDLVLTKNNNKKSKFEPTFNEQPMVVSAIENDGKIYSHEYYNI